MGRAHRRPAPNTRSSPRALRIAVDAPLLTDGRLFIVAADHSARGMLGVPGEPFAMADRRRTLESLLIALDSRRRRRRARQRRHHGGPRAAGRARRQARVRDDEPRRDHGRELGARRPDDRVLGATIADHGLDGGKVLLRLGRRRRRHRLDPRGVRPRRRRVRGSRPADHGRAAAVPPRPRRPAPRNCSTTTTRCCAPSRSVRVSAARRPRRG